MVDRERVCCMCGDVGFSDKLFHCNHCRNRFQHFYCSNYYSELAEPTEICDWCRRDDPRNGGGGGSGSGSWKKSSSSSGFTNRSEYPSGDRIKRNNRHDALDKNGGGAPSPRTATRRYKLLKDVMC